MINVSLWSTARSVASLQIGRAGPTATLIDGAIRLGSNFEDTSHL